ncbi:MAG: Lrp/AsnC family transcriptional regulator [Pseudomonadota bacterium]
MDLDDLDLKILRLLQGDSRIGQAVLGARVGLSVSAVNARLARLRKTGAIKDFSVNLDPLRLGLGLLAFVQALLERPEHEKFFLEAVEALDEIQECHHVTGDFSYLLKVRTRDAAGLEKLLTKLKSIPGLARTKTVIALSSPKETSRLPLAPPALEVEEP